VVLLVTLGAGKRAGDAIVLRTRSVYDLFKIAAASVDVPAEHLQSGRARAHPTTSPAGVAIRIHRSSQRPGDAMVAVKHDGWWFFIDGTDSISKDTIRLLESLLVARIAESVNVHAAPTLMVPVSR
jgi:hypothetical protein